MTGGDAVALLGGHRTCDLQVAGSSSGWAPLYSGLWQVSYTRVPLSPSSIIWYQPGGGDLFGWESNCRPGGKYRQRTTKFMTKSLPG